MAPTGYGHFFVEHNRGHHVRVATPEDPASSRLGESYYRFWPRTVLGSLRSAWRLETARHRLRGRTPWSVRNEILHAWAMTVALFAVLTLGFGPGGAAVPVATGRGRPLRPGGGQLSRALRPAAAAQRRSAATSG
nr:hypothetical protein GCM10020092_072770 [Actinoplanes digitatis]